MNALVKIFCNNRLFRQAIFLVVSLQTIPAVAQRVCWMPGDAIFPASGFSLEKSDENGKNTLVLVHSEYAMANNAGFYSYGGFARLALIGEEDSIVKVAKATDFALNVAHSTGFYVQFPQ